MSAPPGRQMVTNNLLAMLQLSTGAGGTGMRIGDNRAPPFGGSPPRTQPDPKLDFPYAVLYDIDGGDRYGDYTDDMTDAEFAYQLSVVGLRRDQAQLMADKAGTVLVGRQASGAYSSTMADPAGISVIRRTLDPPVGVLKQGEAQQLVWLAPVRFRLMVCAA